MNNYPAPIPREEMFVGAFEPVETEFFVVSENGDQLPAKVMLSGEIVIRYTQGQGEILRLALNGARIAEDVTESTFPDGERPLPPPHPLQIISIKGPFSTALIDETRQMVKTILLIHYTGLENSPAAITQPTWILMRCTLQWASFGVDGEGATFQGLKVSAQEIEDFPPLNEILEKYIHPTPPCPPSQEQPSQENPESGQEAIVTPVHPSEPLAASEWGKTMIFPRLQLQFELPVIDTLTLQQYQPYLPKPLGQVAMFSVAMGAPTLCPDSADPQKEVDELRILPVRFINLTNTLDNVTLTPLCRSQISQNPQGLAACDIWNYKGALNLRVQWDVNGLVFEAPQIYKDELHNFTSPDEANFLPDPDPTAVNVYIVDKLQVDDLNGNLIETGITYGGGAGGAKIVLSKTAMPLNCTLLAHELVHALGLDHPNGAGINKGAPGTIAEPPTNAPTSPDRNTKANLEFLRSKSSINPNVIHTTQPGLWRYDL